MVKRPRRRKVEPRPAEVWDRFLKVWQALRMESVESSTVIVVEGDRDRKSLRRLGIRGPIALLHHGQAVGTTAQQLTRRGGLVIVLTDWDTEGGHLAHRLKEFLEADSVRLDLEYRRRLAVILRGELVHVEGLARWAQRMAERAGAPLDHFLTDLEP